MSSEQNSGGAKRDHLTSRYTLPLTETIFTAIKQPLNLYTAAGLIKIEPQTVLGASGSSHGFIKIEREAGPDLDSTYSPSSLHSPSPPNSPAGGKIKASIYRSLSCYVNS